MFIAHIGIRSHLPAAVLILLSISLLTVSAVSQDALSTEAADAKAGTTSIAAAPSLTITPITWGVVGLDSNNLTVGPNTFPVGARVCNTGSPDATNLVSTFVWESANANVNLRSGTNASLTLPSLAAGACTDFYYEIEVNRVAASYNTTRRYKITATADTLSVISTPTPREIYVEKLVSQNRNSVTSIKLGATTIPFGGTMNMTVGGTYTIQLNAKTSTNGYEQIESFINLPNVVFQVLSVSGTYTAPTGYTGTKLYEDACGWDSVPASGTYRSCIGPANTTTGKAGGDISITYTVKVIGGGGTSSTLNTLIYDFSGSSYHYNDDFSSTSVIAQIAPPPSAANVSIAGRAMLAEGNGIRNAYVTLTEMDGQQHTVLTGPFGYYRFDDIQAGQSVVVSISSKRYTFNPSSRVVSLDDDLSDLDFIAEQ